MGVYCKTCGGLTKVIKTKPTSTGINRTRVCRDCGTRMPTVERVDDTRATA